MSWSVTAEYRPTLTDTSPKDSAPFQEGRGTAATSDQDGEEERSTTTLPVRRVVVPDRRLLVLGLVRVGRGVGVDRDGARCGVETGDVVAAVDRVVARVALLEAV